MSLLSISLLPKVQLVDVIKLDEDDGREDEDGRGDEQEDVAEIQKLLVLCRLPLHHRQCRFGRS